jgi:hypothetical protein
VIDLKKQMIERTKVRLEDARTLFAKLRAERFKQVQDADPVASPAFFSLLNDFITTARTVTWVLGNEEKEKYDAWKSSPGAAINPAEQAILDFVTTMRNSIEKRGQPGIEVRREWVEIPENPNPFSGTQHFGLPDWGRPTTMIDVYYVEGTSREVVSLCEQYLGILTRLINEFEKAHAS